MNTRLLGAAVLIALAVLFVPMFFSSTPPAPGGDQAVNLAIPPAPDRDLQTRTMSLAPDAASASGTVAPPAETVTPGSGDRLATVNIGSSRPRDVETDPQAGQAPPPTTVTIGSGASPSQPVIPQRDKPTATTPPAASKPSASVEPAKPVAVTPKPAPTPAAVGRGNYTLNLSAYASAAGAASLERRALAN